MSHAARAASRGLRFAGLLLPLLLLAACAPYALRAGREAAPPAPPLVVVLGDSVAAGYGLRPEQAFPAVLQELLAAAGRPAEVRNAGLSGDTTAGGRARLPELYPPHTPRPPDLLILELGANDAIQGRDLALVEADLEAMLRLALEGGSRVLLTGIGAGLKRNDPYRAAFEAMYRRLAEKHGMPLYPRIGEGVRGDPRFVQADGAHPNPEGARIIAANLLPLVRRLLEAPRP